MSEVDAVGVGFTPFRVGFRGVTLRIRVIGWMVRELLSWWIRSPGSVVVAWVSFGEGGIGRPSETCLQLPPGFGRSW